MKYQDLLDKCLRDEPFAKTELFNTMYHSMLNVCLRYSNNKEDAEEAVNDGFIQVFSNIHGFKSYGSFEAWVYTIMKNAALRKTRKKSRTILVETMPETKAHNDTLDLDLPILLALVKDLPPGYRKIFKLYAIDGLPHDKIARKLKISEGTSKSQLSRAKRKLQDQVKILFSI